MADVRLLGTPYIRGKAVPVGKKLVQYRTDAPLTIGDTVLGNEIPWIEVNGLLVAQKNVLRGVFRQMLANSGLIHGNQREWVTIREEFPDAPRQFAGAIWSQEGLCTMPPGPYIHNPWGLWLRLVASPGAMFLALCGADRQARGGIL